jgi:hypothetical protein
LLDGIAGAACHGLGVEDRPGKTPADYAGEELILFFSQAGSGTVFITHAEI